MTEEDASHDGPAAGREGARVRAVIGRLSLLGAVNSRRVWGAAGLYYRGTLLFGFVCGGELYFKVGPDTVTKYLAHEMRPFRPGPRQPLRGFWAVPAEVVADDGRLLAWAVWAVESARQFGARRRPRPLKRPRKSSDTMNPAGRTRTAPGVTHDQPTDGRGGDHPTTDGAACGDTTTPARDRGRFLRQD